MSLTKTSPSKSLAATEFATASLGDQRLNVRLFAIVERLEERPNATFPEAMGTSAEAEAFYRFLRNDKTSFDALFEPHREATVNRCAEHETVLVLHDTSEVRYKGSTRRKGLGVVGQSGQGYLCHLALAVAPGQLRDPLGVLHVEQLVRPEGKVSPTKLIRQGKASYKETADMEREQERWKRGVDATSQALAGRTRAIHVTDSEGDDYKLMAKMGGEDVSDKHDFVIRLHYDRVLDLQQSEARKISEALASRPVVATREVVLSRRDRQPASGSRKRQAVREQRKATLEIRAGRVVLRRPSSAPKNLPPTLAVNIVQVQEPNPPEGTVPVEWVLATTEPIETPEQILAVVDIYRSRWLVEEYFKALKTGCSLEKRQLESTQTLWVALALFIPIAWSLLRLRNIARDEPDLPAQGVLTEEELEVLQAVEDCRLSAAPTAREAMLAVARLGGHLRQNGEPGWIVLGRGYLRLLTLVRGYLLGKAAATRR